MSNRADKLKNIMRLANPIKSFNRVHRNLNIVFQDPAFKDLNFGFIESIDMWTGSITIKRLFTNKYSEEILVTKLEDIEMYEYNEYEVNYCTCGSKHTTNPRWHLSYCYFGKR